MMDSGTGLNQSGIVRTKNGYGWSSTVPNQVTCAAAQHVRETGRNLLVLDIGAGLGVGTLPLLQAGARVIALDIEEKHLAVIREEAQRQGYNDRLETVCGEFPFVEFGGLDVAHCSNVLHFLSGDRIRMGAHKIHRWLNPGGKIFIQVGTIYGGHIARLLPFFEERRSQGIEWAGETDQAKDYVAPEYRDATPNSMNYLYAEPIIATFEQAGFRTLQAWYYTRTGLPEDMRFDGREHFGYLGTKC